MSPITRCGPFLDRDLAEVEGELVPVGWIDGDGDPHGLAVAVEGRLGRLDDRCPAVCGQLTEIGLVGVGSAHHHQSR
jgi:hypothetical protein